MNEWKEVFDETNNFKKYPAERSDLIIQGDLSRGKFGAADQLALDTTKNQYVALKKITHEDEESYKQQLNILRKCAMHPSIITIFGCLPTTESCHLYVYEFLSTRLSDLVVTNVGIPDAPCKSIIKQVINGLNFLHQKVGVVHSDLQPDNIAMLSFRQCRVKVTNFDKALNIGQSFSKLKHCLPRQFNRSNYKSYTESGYNEYYSYPYCDEAIKQRQASDLFSMAFLAPNLLSPEDKMIVTKELDFWALSILIVFCVSGSVLWKKATNTCPEYAALKKDPKSLNHLLMKVYKVVDNPGSYATRRNFPRDLERKASDASSSVVKEIYPLTKDLDHLLIAIFFKTKEKRSMSETIEAMFEVGWGIEEHKLPHYQNCRFEDSIFSSKVDDENLYECQIERY